MPNTKLTKEKLANHFHYSKWIYILVTAAIVGLASVIFTMTRSQIANEQSVEIAFVGSFVDIEPIAADEKKLLEQAQSFDASLEQVKFMPILYDGSEGMTEEAVYGAQQYMVQTTAGSNDIFILPLSMAEELILQDTCLPFDTLEMYEQFIALYPDVTRYEYPQPTEASVIAYRNGEAYEFAEDAPRHVYALDVSCMTGLNSRGIFDAAGYTANPEDEKAVRVAVLYVTGKNPETSFYVLSDMYRLFVPEEAQ